MLLSLQTENQTVFMHWLLIIPEKSHFGPISSPFWSKNLKTRFFSKKLLRSVLSLGTTVTLCKKNQKNSECQFFIKLEKSHSGPILAPFGPKISKQDFLKELIYVKLDFIFLWFHVKKKKKSTHWFVIKLEKPHPRPTLGPIGQKNQKQFFFSKNQALSLLLLSSYQIF